MSAYAFVDHAIMLEVFATAMAKASERFTRPWPSLTTALGYGAAFYCLSLVVLRNMPVGGPTRSGRARASCARRVVALVMFGQQLDPPALAGVGLVTAGVGDPPASKTTGTLNAGRATCPSAPDALLKGSCAVRRR